MTVSSDPPPDWWETVRGSAVTLGLSMTLALWAVSGAWRDSTGGGWLAAGIALILTGMAAANVVHAVAAADRARRRNARPPTRHYDWGREPREDTSP